MCCVRISARVTQSFEHNGIVLRDQAIALTILVFHSHWLFNICALEPDLRGSLNKFPDFFRIGTFIDSTHMKL